MRSLVALSVPLTVLFAGCAALEDLPGFGKDGPPADPSFSFPWFQEECRTGSALIAIPRSRASEYLPEGYSPSGTFAVFGAPTTGEDAALVVEMFQCARLGYLGGGLQQGGAGGVYIVVDPPDEHRRGGASSYFYRLSYATTVEPILSLFAKAGEPVERGVVDVTLAPATVPIRTEGEARIHTGASQYDVATDTGPGQPRTFAFREIRETPSGVVYLDGTYNVTFQVGTARVTANQGSLLADVLRATSATGVGVAATDGNYIDSVVSFRAR